MDDDQHWMQSGVNLWQLVIAIVGVLMAGGTTWVIADRSMEQRLTRLEVSAEYGKQRNDDQDQNIERLRNIAAVNQIALSDIKARIEALSSQLALITASLDGNRYMRNKQGGQQ